MIDYGLTPLNSKSDENFLDFKRALFSNDNIRNVGSKHSFNGTKLIPI